MALSANVVFEVQTTGADGNGGGFDAVSGTPGTDYTYGGGQTTIEWAAAGGDHTNDLAATDAAPSVLSSAARNFIAADVGNLIYISAGTNFTAGWYQIMSVAANAATLDRNASSGGAASAGLGILGGALATPGGFGLVRANHGVAGWHCHIKTGTYSMSSAVANVLGGTFSASDSFTLWVEGYGTSRGDRGAKPVLDANAETGITLWNAQSGISSQPHIFVNLKADGQDGAGTKGFASATSIRDMCIGCEAVDCPVGFYAIWVNRCLATSCATYGYQFTVGGQQGDSSVADACGVGFLVTDAFLVDCIAFDCTGNGFENTQRGAFSRCTSYNNGGDGFDLAASTLADVQDCVAVNNTGAGFNCVSVVSLENCAGYNNTGGNHNSTGHIVSFEALTGDPFDNGGTGDFRPNNTAGEGASLRGAADGLPGQTNNRDIGAVQHADPAGGGVIVPVSQTTFVPAQFRPTPY